MNHQCDVPQRRALVCKLTRAFPGALSTWNALDRESLLELRTEFVTLYGQDYLKYLPVVLIDFLAREAMPEGLDNLVFSLNGNHHYDPDVDRAIAAMLGGKLSYSEQESRERAEQVCEEIQEQLGLVNPLQSQAVLEWLEYYRRYACKCFCERLCEEAIQYWTKRVSQKAPGPPM